MIRVARTAMSMILVSGAVVARAEAAATPVRLDASAQDVVIVSGRRLFDPWDRVLRQWHPTEERKEDSTNARFHAGRDTVDPTVFEYDVLDRLTSTTLPDLTSTTQTYALAPDPGGTGALRSLTTVVVPGGL